MRVVRLRTQKTSRLRGRGPCVAWWGGVNAVWCVSVGGVLVLWPGPGCGCGLSFMRKGVPIFFYWTKLRRRSRERSPVACHASVPSVMSRSKLLSTSRHATFKYSVRPSGPSPPTRRAATVVVTPPSSSGIGPSPIPGIPPGPCLAPLPPPPPTTSSTPHDLRSRLLVARIHTHTNHAAARQRRVPFEWARPSL